MNSCHFCKGAPNKKGIKYCFATSIQSPNPTFVNYVCASPLILSCITSCLAGSAWFCLIEIPSTLKQVNHSCLLIPGFPSLSHDLINPWRQFGLCSRNRIKPWKNHSRKHQKVSAISSNPFRSESQWLKNHWKKRKIWLVR